MVTGVWVGNDDGDEMKKVTGSGLPAEIWQRFMRESHAGQPVVALPGLGWRNQPQTALPSSGPILPPANVGTVTPRQPSATARPTQPAGADDANPHGFVRQSLPQGPSREERSLLQRLTGG
jgi:penicillin-binding protein 1A